MNKSNALSWSSMLMATLLFGVALGFSIGYVTFSPRSPATESAHAAPPKAAAPASPAPEPATAATPSTAPAAAPAAATAPVQKTAAAPVTPPPSETAPKIVPVQSGDGYWAARHLIVAVNGQWLADSTKALLKEVRPGAVLLQDVNLGSRTQTFALVKEIKAAEGLGEGLGDLPLIGVQQEGGPYNLLGVENAPSAQALGQNGDPELARKTGQLYGEACVGRGIAIAFAPVLDVFEAGAINPGFAVRSFGTEHTLVARVGLAMADGLRQGGVLPVVKHFPGYGAATYGSDGLLVALNKDPSGLGRLLYPFDQAVRRGVPGILVAHVAVPALDPENPRRSAALSPVLVGELLRARWGYEGVIVADDIALNSMTRTMGAEQAAVQALAAGCDAVMMLDPDPAKIRAVSVAISDAVVKGTLSKEKLQQSVARLQRWQEAIGNLNPIKPAADAGRVAEATVPAHVMDAPAAAAPTPSPATNETAPAPIPATTVEGTPTPPPQKAATPEPAPAVSAPVVSAQPPATKEAAPPDTQTKPAPSAAAAPAPAGTEGASRIEHTLHPGEKLSDVARDFSVSVEDIVRWNSLTTAAPGVGTKLTLYLKDGGAIPPADLASAAKKKMAEAKKSAPKPASTPEVPAGMPVKAVHKVEAGETLPQIAEKYKVAAADIKLWNGLESDKLETGSTLTIFLGNDAAPKAAKSEPAKASAPAAAPPPAAPAVEPAPAATPDADAPADTAAEDFATATEEYVVLAGDTVNKISKKYNTTRETILQLNGLKDPNQIRVGQTLKVPKPAE